MASVLGRRPLVAILETLEKEGIQEEPEMDEARIKTEMEAASFMKLKSKQALEGMVDSM